MHLGRGSLNTIQEHLETWWSRLGARLRACRGASSRIYPPTPSPGTSRASGPTRSRAHMRRSTARPATGSAIWRIARNWDVTRYCRRHPRHIPPAINDGRARTRRASGHGAHLDSGCSLFHRDPLVSRARRLVVWILQASTHGPPAPAKRFQPRREPKPFGPRQQSV